MPIYEYHCESCDSVFEEIHQHADDIMEEPCPKCDKSAHRMISNTTFVLKGGGWYVTEYGNKKKADSASGAANEASSADAKEKMPGTDTAPPASAPATAPASKPAESASAAAS
jgi:putative FmdB family regulatory protein